MRSAFTEDEEDLDRPADRESDHPYADDDREVTLSSTTLLVIFFGLVLVCGLFFGLGYSLGRRSHTETADVLPAAEPASAPLVASAQPKPSPAAQSAAVQASDTSGADAATPAPVDDSNQAATPAVSTPAETPAKPAPQSRTPSSTTATSQVKPALAPAAMQASPTAAPSGIMVQIAAVSNPADAEVLVGALRKRGYSVTTRKQPGDTLLHVQVGPFSTRADAVTMKQKLLADGYNAILK